MKTPEDRAQSIWAPTGTREIAQQIREAISDEREAIAVHLEQQSALFRDDIRQTLKDMAFQVRNRR